MCGVGREEEGRRGDWTSCDLQSLSRIWPTLGCSLVDRYINLVPLCDLMRMVRSVNVVISEPVSRYVKRLLFRCCCYQEPASTIICEGRPADTASVSTRPRLDV